MKGLNSESPPLLDLYFAYDGWKEEHDALHARLLELCRYMRWNPSNYDMADWGAHHRKVRNLFVPFMQDWRRHVQREKQTIYPLAKSAGGGGRMGAVTALEQDDLIAEPYYRAYEKAVADGASPEDALSLLLQVLVIVAEHFRVENEIVVPFTEKLMDEIAYIGS
jgi:hypothetical protein